MEIVEVVDRKSLQAYLEGLEGDAGLLTTRRVAFFAAISVAPAALRFLAGNQILPNRDLTPLAVLGAYSISGIVSIIPTPEIASSAAAAAAATACTEAGFGTAAATSSSAASSAAYSSSSAAYSSSSVSAATGASYAAASSSDFDASDFWCDLRIFLTGQQTAPDAPMPAITLDAARVEDWSQTRILLRDDSAVDWTFWIAWFDRVLAGKNIYADLLAPILNGLTKDDWLGDPAKVNPLFDHILPLYAVEATQIGERIRLNADQEYFAEPVTKLPNEILTEAIERAEDAVADFTILIQGQQSYLGDFTELTAQIAIWLDRYGDRPLRLYEKLADAHDLITDVARDSGLTQEKVVLIFQRELERSRTDIRAGDPQVEERINARVRVRYDEMEQPEQQAFLTVVAEGAAGAEPGLRSEMQEDLPLIAGDNGSPEVRTRALVREGERAIQINYLRAGFDAPAEEPKTASAVDKVAKGADTFNKMNKAAQGSWYIVTEIAKWFL